jgi:4-amino-4-deoxy-L-arabinose transferase-like glycosyltransferase
MNKIFIRKNWLTIILIISVVVRVMAAFYLGNEVVNLPGTYDQISYNTLAIRILNGFGFSFGETWWPITQPGAPTAHWSFLYTLYLTGVYLLFGLNPLVARLIQAILVGLLQPFLAYKIGRRLFSDTVGLVAAGLTAFYIYFFYYGATLMTEPFFITAVMGGLYLTILLAQQVTDENKSNSINTIKLSVYLGFTLAAAVLLRQLFLLFIPVLFFWTLWVQRKKELRLTIIAILISSLIIILAILPFTIYNFSRFGSFVLLNTNSGYAFFWSNHPIYGTHFLSILPPEMGTYQSLIPPELRNLNEAALDQALLRRGIQFIIDAPIRYILLSLSRIPAFFMFWPSTDSSMISNISRVASFGVMWPFMLIGLFRAFADQTLAFKDRLTAPSMILILFIVIYTLIHLLTWALIRYRLPVDAVLLVFAALAIVDLSQRIKTWWSTLLRSV